MGDIMYSRIISICVLVVGFHTTRCMDLPTPPPVAHSSVVAQNRIMALKFRAFLRDMIDLTIPNNPPTILELKERHHQLLSYVTRNPSEMDTILKEANLGSLQQISSMVPHIMIEYTAVTTQPISSENDLKKRIITVIDSAITKIDFNTITDLSTLTTRADGIKLSNYPASIQLVIQDILNKYLNNLPLEMKKRIIMAYLELDPSASQEELMAAVLLESGPIIQKLFQLIGQSATSESLKKVMSQLQTQLKPVPLEVSKNIISTALGQDFALFAQAIFKNLGAASIAQAILVKTPNGEEFIIKVLKPGIPEKIHQEYGILINKVVTQQAGKEKITQIYHNIVEELDFRSEAQYLQQGHRLYQYCQGNGFITTPYIPKGNFIHQNVLVMSKAPGKPLSAVTSPDTQLTKLLALYQFYFLWLREALFESGFFHGDTHAGNLFLDIKNNKAQRFTFTPIDFGACAQLNQHEQANIILLTLGLELNIPYFVATAVAQLATNQYDKTTLDARLTILLTAKNVPPTQELNTIAIQVKQLFSKNIQNWGMQEKMIAFELATKLLNICTTLEVNRSDPSKYTQLMELIDTLNISLPASFNLFVRGQRFLEGQINTILQEQKLSGEQFYNSLFGQLANPANPILAIPKFLSPFSKNIIINLIMNGLQKYLKNMPCNIL